MPLTSAVTGAANRTISLRRSHVAATVEAERLNTHKHRPTNDEVKDSVQAADTLLTAQQRVTGRLGGKHRLTFLDVEMNAARPLSRMADNLTGN